MEHAIAQPCEHGDGGKGDEGMGESDQRQASGAQLQPAAQQRTRRQLGKISLDLADQLLFPGGHFLGKLFQGPDFQRLRARLQSSYSEVRIVKPDSSRKESIELYLLALRRKAPL